MKHETMNLLERTGPACTSYAAGVIAYAQNLDIMQVGAVVLLLARMAIDIPPAIKSIKKLMTGSPAPKKKKPKAKR